MYGYGEKKKQLPFRYPESLQEDIDLIDESLKNWSNSKNKAIINGIRIASAYIRHLKKTKECKNLNSWKLRGKIEEKLTINLIR
jgi:hypothetical protein